MIFCVGWVEPTGAAIKPARGETHRNVSRASVGFAKSSTHAKNEAASTSPAVAQRSSVACRRAACSASRRHRGMAGFP